MYSIIFLGVGDPESVYLSSTIYLLSSLKFRLFVYLLPQSVKYICLSFGP
jgi:hypothetical protein